MQNGIKLIWYLKPYVFIIDLSPYDIWIMWLLFWKKLSGVFTEVTIKNVQLPIQLCLLLLLICCSHVANISIEIRLTKNTIISNRKWIHYCVRQNWPIMKSLINSHDMILVWEVKCMIRIYIYIYIYIPRVFYYHITF